MAQISQNNRIKTIHNLVIVLLIVNSSVLIGASLSKCCPVDGEININSDSIENCVKRGNRSKWNSYNVDLSTNETQFPKCNRDSKKTFQVSTDFVEVNGCLDKSSDGQLYAIHCKEQPGVLVHKLNKCCQTNHSYDYIKRLCVPNTDSVLHFQELFGDNFVVFEPNVPNCADDEAFFEYHTIAHDIDFVDRNLKIVSEHFPSGEMIQSNKYCIEGLVNTDTDKNKRHVIVRSCRPKTICDRIPCIRRCCKSDQMMEMNWDNNTVNCVQHPENMNFKPVFYDIKTPVESIHQQSYAHPKEYGVLHSMHCRKFILEKPDATDKNGQIDVYGLHKDGNLYANKAMYSVDHYCIELTQMDTIDLSTFICHVDEQMEHSFNKFKVYPIGLMISCIFLALTLLVYLSLPKLLNLHGKTLVCYIISLLFAYSALAVMQISVEKPSYCFEMVFIILFSLMATFCWQMIMCIDIWHRIGSFNSSYNMLSTEQNHRRFIYYSMYGWGMPMIWTTFAFCVANYQFLPIDWAPNVGETTCFFSKELHWNSYFTFYLFPAIIHVTISIILFIVAAIKCNRVQREIHRMQTQTSNHVRFTKLKAVFKMNMELVIVMGVTWVLEFVSGFIENDIIQLLLDICNLGRGFLIFVIFVCKRRVLTEMFRRIEGFLTSIDGETGASVRSNYTKDLVSGLSYKHVLSGRNVQDNLLPFRGRISSYRI